MPYTLNPKPVNPKPHTRSGICDAFMPYTLHPKPLNPKPQTRSGICDAFMSGFWYINMLANSASSGIKVRCLHTRLRMTKPETLELDLGLEAQNDKARNT